MHGDRSYRSYRHRTARHGQSETIPRLESARADLCARADSVVPPIALAGVIFGVMSSSRYDAGDYGGAKSMSTAAAWMLILSIAFALFTAPFGFSLFTGCI